MERINPQFALLPLESAASLLPESALEITTALAFDALIQCMVYQFASDTRGTPGGAGIAIDWGLAGNFGFRFPKGTRSGLSRAQIVYKAFFSSRAGASALASAE